MWILYCKNLKIGLKLFFSHNFNHYPQFILVHENGYIYFPYSLKCSTDHHYTGFIMDLIKVGILRNKNVKFFTLLVLYCYKLSYSLVVVTCARKLKLMVRVRSLAMCRRELFAGIFQRMS